MILLMLAAVSYGALVLDAGGGLWALPAGTMPHFLFLAAAIAVLNYKGPGAIFWSVVAGLFADVVHGAPLGLNVVLLSNLTFLSQALGARGSRDSLVSSAAFVLLYVTIAGFVSLAGQEVLAGVIPDFGRATKLAASRAGGTATVYLVVAGAWKLWVRLVELILQRPDALSDRPNWAR